MQDFGGHLHDDLLDRPFVFRRDADIRVDFEKERRPLKEDTPQSTGGPTLEEPAISLVWVKIGVRLKSQLHTPGT